MADDDDKVILEDDTVESRNVHEEHECVAIVSRMQEKYSTETAEKREETTDNRRNTERAKANW
jgi:hypothetical protein